MLAEAGHEHGVEALRLGVGAQGTNARFGAEDGVDGALDGGRTGSGSGEAGHGDVGGKVGRGHADARVRH